MDHQTELLQTAFSGGMVPVAYSACSDVHSRELLVTVRVKHLRLDARGIIDLRFDPGHVPGWLRLEILTFCGGPNA